MTAAMLDVTPPPSRRGGQSAINALWAAVALLTLATGYLVWQVSSLDTTVSELSDGVGINREVSYENRSVECRLALAHGIELRSDGPCYEPEVLRFYNPTTVPKTASSSDAVTNRAIDCAQLRILGGEHSACRGL